MTACVTAHGFCSAAQKWRSWTERGDAAPAGRFRPEVLGAPALKARNQDQKAPKSKERAEVREGKRRLESALPRLRDAFDVPSTQAAREKRASAASPPIRLFAAFARRRCAIGEKGVFHERLDAAEVFLTSDGRRPNCARKRLLKWEELLKPIEYAISVIVFESCCGEDSRS